MVNAYAFVIASGVITDVTVTTISSKLACESTATLPDVIGPRVSTGSVARTYSTPIPSARLAE